MQTDLFPQTTPESLTEAMVGKLQTNLQTNEGGYTRDLLSVVGLALFEGYKTLNKLLPIAFVDETSGEYLEARCAEYGITRKPGTAARVSLEFSGQNGTKIPVGTTVSTQGGLLFSTTEPGEIQEGKALAEAVSQQAGMACNVPPGALTRLVTPVGGVERVQIERRLKAARTWRATKACLPGWTSTGKTGRLLETLRIMSSGGWRCPVWVPCRCCPSGMGLARSR